MKKLFIGLAAIATFFAMVSSCFACLGWVYEPKKR
ncbi:MAG: cyclic lactone autoinducer peptide [Firmicutes bacterium]|nr:cyclic lactone autoinducer peptide [Bacillota bacterium]